MAELKFQTIDLDEVPQGVRVKLGGIIDVTTADTFRATLLTLLSVGFRRIMLDFKDVQFVNSTGFASMVEVSQHLRETGGVIVLSEMRPEVKDICVDLGLDAFFSVAGSEQEALNVLVASQVQPLDDLEDDEGEAAEFYIGPEEDLQGAGSEWTSGELVRGDSEEGAATAEVAEGAQAPVSPFAEAAHLELDDALELDYRASNDDLDIAELIDKAEGESSGSLASTSTVEADAEEVEVADDYQPAGSDFPDAVAPQAAVTPLDARDPSEPLEAIPAEPGTEAAAEPVEWLNGEPAAGLVEAPVTDPSSASHLRLPTVRSDEEGKRPGTEKLRKDANETRAVRNREAADRARAAAMVTQIPGRSSESDKKKKTGRRERNLKAMASLLATIPTGNRLWRKALIYVSKDSQTQVPSLNLVLAKLPNNRATPDAFLVSEANPYVTIVPKIPNGIAVPERLAVDVTKGGDEISFKVQPDRASNRLDAVSGRPRLEVWYGPTLVRTVRMPDPFEA